MNRLVAAAILASGAELVHAILASVALGGIYSAGVFRFALITAIGVFAVLSRQSWARWILVGVCAWWAVDYGAQAASRMDLGLALVALALAAAAILLGIARPVHEPQ